MHTGILESLLKVMRRSTLARGAFGVAIARACRTTQAEMPNLPTSPAQLEYFSSPKNSSMVALEASLATPYKYYRRKRPMRELDVPASRPAFHAKGRVLALRYFGETSRRTCTCTCTWMYVCMHASMHVCMFACMYDMHALKNRGARTRTCTAKMYASM